MRSADSELVSLTSELHPNSHISELRVPPASGDGIEVGTIETEGLTLVPIFEVESSDACHLFRQADAEVLRHYSEENMDHPVRINDFIEQSAEKWDTGDRYEFAIKSGDELVGKTYLRQQGDTAAYVLGIWLLKPYWGNGISGRRADALLHLAFRQLGVAVVTVGTVVENEKSRQAIEKYVSRYGGQFMGNMVLPDALYHNPDDPTKTVRHSEWVITSTDFETTEQGVTTTLPGVSYDQVGF